MHLDPKRLAVVVAALLLAACGPATQPGAPADGARSDAAKNGPPPSSPPPNACGKRKGGNFANCDGVPSNGCETDVNSSLSSCGACGNVCGVPANGFATCTNGRCGVGCDAGYVSDGSSCNLEPLTCASGTADCNGNPGDGCETSLATVTNCSGCGDACTAPDHAQPTCSGSGSTRQCSWTCDSGYAASGDACVPAEPSCGAGTANCNASGADGCETNVASDAANCGACGNACTAPANATASCTNGSCGFTCAVGYVASGDSCVVAPPPTCAAGTADCNGNAGDGCEAQVGGSDCANCGACGQVCPAGSSCVNGVCGTEVGVVPDASCPGGVACTFEGQRTGCAGYDGTISVCAYPACQ